jgi:hypothetical protein
VQSSGGEGAIKLNVFDDIGDDAYGDGKVSEGGETDIVRDGYAENVFVANESSKVKCQLRDLAKDLEESTSPLRGKKPKADEDEDEDEDEQDLLDLMDQM